MGYGVLGIVTVNYCSRLVQAFATINGRVLTIFQSQPGLIRLIRNFVMFGSRSLRELSVYSPILAAALLSLHQILEFSSSCNSQLCRSAAMGTPLKTPDNRHRGIQ